MHKILNANTIVNLNEISHEEWLELRKKGIGGSDAGAIVGVNPYSSAFQVYCDKKGLMPETEDNEAMRQGRDLEAYVARRFEEKERKNYTTLQFYVATSRTRFYACQCRPSDCWRKGGA